LDHELRKILTSDPKGWSQKEATAVQKWLSRPPDAWDRKGDERALAERCLAESEHLHCGPRDYLIFSINMMRAHCQFERPNHLDA
jgi:hypothetical protein